MLNLRDPSLRLRGRQTSRITSAVELTYYSHLTLPESNYLSQISQGIPGPRLRSPKRGYAHVMFPEEMRHGRSFGFSFVAFFSLFTLSVRNAGDSSGERVKECVRGVQLR